MLRYRPTNLSPGNFPVNKSQTMESTLMLTQNLRKRRNSAIWGTVNIILLAFLIYDLFVYSMYKCPLYSTWFNYLEYTAAGIFALNTVYHLYRYFYFTLKTESVTVTPTQKRLLGFKDNDSYCKVKPTSTPVMSPAAMIKSADTSLHCTPLNWSAASWRSSGSNESQNYSLASPSWVFYRGSPEQRAALNTTPHKLQFADTSDVESITDEKSLKQYMQDYEHFEKSMNASNPTEQSSNLLSSFWSHPATQNPNEVSPYLRRNQYQLSAQVPSNVNSSTGKIDESRSALNICALGNEIWRKLQIDSQKLTLWNANLRMWISQTILDRLVNEIALVNDEFAKLHLNDIKIGNVGLERLRKTAQTMPVIQYVPTLTALIPFLEVTPNQEYLIKRIKELAKGGCMSDFKWNSGGSYNGKEWDDSLLNDSEIIIHLLATYLDSQLLPLPNQPDARPFSKEHFIRHAEKVPQSPLTLAIHQVTEKPPHFRLIAGEDVFEVAKGHNNLFYTILLFLYFVNKKEHGMLGKVNMGRSGVNMLWIIEGN